MEKKGKYAKVYANLGKGYSVSGNKFNYVTIHKKGSNFL